MKTYKLYPIISGLFTASLLISNILDTKIFEFMGLNLPAGIIIFPIAYVFGDFLTEVYGYSASRKVIWTGFFSLIFLIISIHIAIILKPAVFWTSQKEFELILTAVPRIVLASITAYFLGEFANSFILAKLKVKTSGKFMSLRFIASTIAGQGIDTITFVLIAFSGTMDLNSLIAITLSAWLVKVLWEIIALPVTLPLVKWIKKVETEDYFDTNTNFNPFIINDKK